MNDRFGRNTYRADTLAEAHERRQRDELKPVMNIPAPFTVDAVQVMLEKHPDTWIAFSADNAGNEKVQWWLMTLGQLADTVVWVAPKDSHPYRAMKRSK